jgi:mannose-6-phosphate isomerase-like protein (cupin superfamily)
MEGFPLPGAIGVSHLRAYEWEAEDGVCGGSPHMHLACTEAYVVTGGRGAVQTLSVDGYRETDLEPGVIAWFSPGTVHRMVQRDDLRITVLMQNSGLPEAGDAVFTFPPEILADPQAYAEAAALPTDDETALRRRDLAIKGYLPLREALRDGDSAPLREFHRAGVALVAPKIDEWTPRWRAGALAAAELTGEHLKALANGDASHLARSGVRVTTPVREGYGMCGRRSEYEIS